MLFCILFLYFDSSTFCVNPVTPSSSPTLFNYLITMHNIITNTPPEHCSAAPAGSIAGNTEAPAGRIVGNISV
jgi:hypothetical protein